MWAQFCCAVKATPSVTAGTTMVVRARAMSTAFNNELQSLRRKLTHGAGAVLDLARIASPAFLAHAGTKALVTHSMSSCIVAVVWANSLAAV